MFERVPELLHRQLPEFVPPFPGSIVKLVGPKSPFLRHGEMSLFLAWRDGQPVGRIAAMLNRTHNRYYQDKVGFFGFFDFSDELEVSGALLSAATQKLKEWGATSARGPYNPSINDECGLLIQGFERPPYILMPFNPPYYLNHFEHLDLKLAKRLYAFSISADVTPPERIEKIVQRVKSRSGITLRNVNLSRLDDELRVLHKLYNDTLTVNWGFVPIDLEDLQASAADLKAFVEPEMVMIAEKDGQPVGFSLALPNLNQFLWETKKMPELLRMAWVGLKLWLSHPTEARLAVLGVEPAFRNKGLGVLFYYESLVRGKRRYKGGELSWVDEDNQEMVRAIETMGGQLYRTYGIFEKAI